MPSPSTLDRRTSLRLGAATLLAITVPGLRAQGGRIADRFSGRIPAEAWNRMANLL